MTAAEIADEARAYDPREIQDKWQQRWAEIDPFRASDDPEDPRERFYLVDMFPYPSGDLHMGHAEAYAIGDALARYWFLRGKNVLHPIGWDAFGLPAENAAIRNNTHPADWTYKNIETQAASFRRYATSFDWSRRLATCDPEYYRWNQWLFLRFYDRGLAYRKGGYVNWCPHDQTVLANEQVINGRCERCGHEVVRRVLTQWYFKITEYADRLLDDAGALEGNWPDRVLTMQRNWIGRSTGAQVHFTVEGRDEPVTVYTTRPDTLYGATFFVVAADSELAAQLCVESRRAEFDAYLAQVGKLTDIERQSTDREKTGVFLGVHAVNPVNGERIPVWAADYVLPDYGTGAIMAVPAHDQRDLDFARRFGVLNPYTLRSTLAFAGRENLSRWRALSKQCWTFLLLLARLRSEGRYTARVADEAILNTEALQHRRWLKSVPRWIGHAYSQRYIAVMQYDFPKVDEQRRPGSLALFVMIERWIAQHGNTVMAPRATYSKPRGRLVWEPMIDYNGRLLCYLGNQLLLLAAGNDIFICSVCHQPYVRDREMKGFRKRPKPGEQNYCGRDVCIRERNRIAAQRHRKKLLKGKKRRD